MVTHRTTALLLGLLVLALAACNRPAADAEPVAQATYAPGDSIRVGGVLIDTRCFHLDKEINRHNDHIRPEGQVAACAQACARLGFPGALLENGAVDGKVWILGGYPAQIYTDYMAQTVRVEGEVRSEGVIVPSKVEYKNGEVWTRIF